LTSDDGSSARNVVTLPEIIVITDPTLPDEGLAEKTDRMLKVVPAGTVAVQLRDKLRPGGAVLRLAKTLRSICSERGAPLYVNDRLDVALAVGADGVHLGSRSVCTRDARRLMGAGAFISVAAHRADEVELAEAGGATAALLSPIFDSPGKGPASGPGLVSSARAKVRDLRLYALGGVDATSAPACMRGGAHGVAVVRALWRAPRIETAVQSLLDAVRGA
jgi:thiamine-phosphate pyrophosphorylase